MSYLADRSDVPMSTGMVAWFPLVIALIGLIVYAVSNHPKISMLGLVWHAAGMIGLCSALASRIVRLL